MRPVGCMRTSGGHGCNQQSFSGWVENRELIEDTLFCIAVFNSVVGDLSTKAFRSGMVSFSERLLTSVGESRSSSSAVIDAETFASSASESDGSGDGRDGIVAALEGRVSDLLCAI